MDMAMAHSFSCHRFYNKPVAGKRMMKITERKTKRNWAYFLEEIAL
jgi:hypothetical protein